MPVRPLPQHLRQAPLRVLRPLPPELYLDKHRLLVTFVFIAEEPRRVLSSVGAALVLPGVPFHRWKIWRTVSLEIGSHVYQVALLVFIRGLFSLRNPWGADSEKRPGRSKPCEPGSLRKQPHTVAVKCARLPPVWVYAVFGSKEQKEESVLILGAGSRSSPPTSTPARLVFVVRTFALRRKGYRTESFHPAERK